MKIVIIGYGKLGKSIAKLAIEKGHEILYKIGSKNKGDLSLENLQKADVIVESSLPSVAYDNLVLCAQSGIPTICGTTGWLDKKEIINELFLEHNNAFLYASNFSVGVNIMFALNQQLAIWMNQQKQFAPIIKEVHHIHKKDSPSGTALTLTKGMLTHLDAYKGWSLESSQDQNIYIDCKREAEVKGIHEVVYESPVDKISIRHEAFDRAAFAEGAILAAEWIINKHGIFTMNDVLGIEC